jgi:imidazole glycerol phosphate synthase subunit HisF
VIKVSLCAADVSAPVLVSVLANRFTPQQFTSGMDASQELQDASLD